MGRTACTEPQCLFKSALYPFTYIRANVYFTLIPTNGNCPKNGIFHRSSEKSNISRRNDQCFCAGILWNSLKGENRVARKLRSFVTDSRNEMERLRMKVVTNLKWGVCGETNINLIAVASPVETQLCVKQILCLLYTGDDRYGQIILNTCK